ncbi:MAG TPA: CHASE3 domain-containing protein, partial [Gammaproteobacteria bacterium]
MEQDPTLAPASTPEPASSIPRQVRLIRAVFVAAVLLLAGTAVLAYYSTAQNAQNAGWVDHTYEVIITTNQVFSELRGATATARGYALTADPSLKDRYQEYSAAIPARIDVLDTLVGDNPEQRGRVASLRSLAGQVLQGLAQTIAARDGHALVDRALVPPVLDTHRQMDDVVTLTRQMAATEADLLAERRSRASEGRHLTIGAIVVGNVIS